MIWGLTRFAGAVLRLESSAMEMRTMIAQLSASVFAIGVLAAVISTIAELSFYLPALEILTAPLGFWPYSLVLLHGTVALYFQLRAIGRAGPFQATLVLVFLYVIYRVGMDMLGQGMETWLPH